LGDEPTQLRRLAYATEARLRQVQDEKEKVTGALKKEKEEALEKLQVVQKEKNEIQAKFEQNNAKI